MGIMSEMGWAIHQMAFPGTVAIVSTAISKFYENEAEERESKQAAKIAVIVRAFAVIGILFFYVLPKIDAAIKIVSYMVW